MFSADEIKNDTIFQILYKYYYSFLLRFYNIQIIGREHISNTDKSIIVISEHTSHNYDIIPGLFALYSKLHKPVRGLSHYYSKYLNPVYTNIGVVTGSRNNMEHLINNNELIALKPGGYEKMAFGSENAYKTKWISKSGNYRCGFARYAYNNDLPVYPMIGKNSEEMAFSPLIYVLNKLNITKFYGTLLTLPEPFGSLFYFLQQICVCMAAYVLMFPIPVNLTFVIGAPITKKENETILEFAKRCESVLDQMNYDINNGYEKNTLRALKERFLVNT